MPIKVSIKFGGLFIFPHTESTKEPLELCVITSDEFTEESLEFCANVAEHLRISGAIDRFLAHLVFLGLPASGKSTLIARLLDLEGVDEMLRASESTGVMDDVIAVNIAEDEASMHAANIDEKNYSWERVEFELSCLRQMGIKFFVHSFVPEVTDPDPEVTNPELKTAPLPKKKHIEGQDASDLETSHSLSPEVVDIEDDPETVPLLKKGHVRGRSVSNLAAKQSQVDVMGIIQSLVRKKRFSSVRPFLENKSSLYLSDTGR